MAGGPATQGIVSPGPRASFEGPLGGVGWAMSWVDYVVYKIEFGAVVTAMIAMTIIEFIYILSIYVVEQKINYVKWTDPETPFEVPYGLLILLLFVGAMMAAVVNNTRLGKKADGELRSLPLRIVASLGLLLFVMVISYTAVLVEDSSTYYLMLTSLIMLPSTAYFFVKKKDKVLGGVMVVATIVSYVASLQVPTGYSWADNFALFLLLWVGFLGSSMAVKQGRHLKIDAARKIWPKKYYHQINGFSDIVTASFTGLIFYIGYIYLFHEDYGRYWANSIGGEIPDWLVVAAIPFSFLLMTLRLVVRGVRRLVWGGLYEKQEANPLAALAAIEVVTEDDADSDSDSDSDSDADSDSGADDKDTGDAEGDAAEGEKS